jgi:amino acid adenylation domain-containing protein
VNGRQAADKGSMSSGETVFLDLMHRHVEHHARCRPAAPALREGGLTLDYGALNRRANAVAARLIAAGLQPGGRVGLCLPASAAALVAMLGILKAGGSYVPVDPRHPADWQQAVLAGTRPQWLVGTPAAGVAPTAPVLVIDETAAAADTDPVGDADLPLDPALPMYVMHTSGSTGRPKGVVVSHGNVARLFPALRPHMAFGPQDLWTMFHSPAFGFSVWEIWGAWVHGGCLLLVPPALASRPDAMLDWLAGEQVTVFSQTPTAFRQWGAALRRRGRGWRLPALRWVAFSGEPLAPAVLAPWLSHFGADQPGLANLYALTETAGEVFFHRVTEADLASENAGCIGLPLADVAVALVDPQGQPVPEGQPGELRLGGPAVALGYHDDPALTAERFLDDAAQPGQRWYCSGDLVLRGPDGRYRFAGRVDRQLKVLGHRIEPAAVEAVLLQHAAVADAVVRTEADAQGQPRLVACLVLHAPGPVPPGLAAWVAERLPPHAVPQRFAVVSHLPLTPNGKLDEAALAVLAAVPGPTRPAAEVAELQPRMAALWCELLERPVVRPEDDFFDLGGHSLLALRLTVEIEAAFGIELTMADLFDAPTLAGLLALLTERLQDPALANPAADAAAEAAAATDAEPHARYMALAIARARLALAEGQPPYAACIVREADGEVLALAHNLTVQQGDATAHAEVEAIREACRRVGRSDLSGCVMVSTAEPCSMCLTAGVWAGIDSMVYGAGMDDEQRYGLAQPTVRAAQMQALLEQRPARLVAGIGRDEVRSLFEQWLRIRALAV